MVIFFYFFPYSFLPFLKRLYRTKSKLFFSKKMLKNALKTRQQKSNDGTTTRDRITLAVGRTCTQVVRAHEVTTHDVTDLYFFICLSAFVSSLI